MMSISPKQLSNPYSTGGGGVHFEARVQAAFTVFMTLGYAPPIHIDSRISKIKLQGKVDGYDTDDCIIYTESISSDRKGRLLCQIKHDISISRNTRFKEVIASAWSDYCNPSFVSGHDSIALITGALDTSDSTHVNPILQWARTSNDEEEFFNKIGNEKFCGKAKRAKFTVFKELLTEINGDIELSQNQIWNFLRSFYLIGYDFDSEEGVSKSLLLALIKSHSTDKPQLVWSRIITFVEEINETAGTFTYQSLPDDIRELFPDVDSSSWDEDMGKLSQHGAYIFKGISNNVEHVHIPRSESIVDLTTKLPENDFIIITGDRGSGKSGLIKEFYDSMSGDTPVFCLRAENLDKPHLDQVLHSIGLLSSIGKLNQGLSLHPEKYLFIESLEKLLELDHQSAFFDLLTLLREQQGWKVIATCREYAYSQIAFSFLQPHDVKFVSISLRGFTDEQVDYICSELPQLKNIQGNDHLKEMLKSPFFVKLFCQILSNGAKLSTSDGERELRKSIWDYLICNNSARANGMPEKRRRLFIELAKHTGSENGFWHSWWRI